MPFLYSLWVKKQKTKKTQVKNKNKNKIIILFKKIYIYKQEGYKNKQKKIL